MNQQLSKEDCLPQCGWASSYPLRAWIGTSLVAQWPRLCTQCRGPRFNPWSGNLISHATTKSLYATTERSLLSKLRPGSVQFSHSVVSDSLRPHESQHNRLPCPSPTPRIHPNSCAWSRWCHPAISSSVVPFSCPQSLPASESFPMSQLTFFSPVATAEFSKFAGILSAALSQHHL